MPYKAGINCYFILIITDIWKIVNKKINKYVKEILALTKKIIYNEYRNFNK